MPKLRVHNFTVSLNGYAAGPDQGMDNPLGVGGLKLHTWAFATRAWRAQHGLDGGEPGLDDDLIAAGDVGIGATIMGRNMFGPIRGAWGGQRAERSEARDQTAPFDQAPGGQRAERGEEEWRGWWGEDPPFHHPVFVLTHHARPSIEMAGGTTFHFVTEGPEAALKRAFDAADGADVRIGGGAATIQQYLRAGLVDEMHVAVVPILLGGGERLFDGALGALPGYECAELVSSPAAAHFRFVRKPENRPA